LDFEEISGRAGGFAFDSILDGPKESTRYPSELVLPFAHVARLISIALLRRGKGRLDDQGLNTRVRQHEAAPLQKALSKQRRHVSLMPLTMRCLYERKSRLHNAIFHQDPSVKDFSDAFNVLGEAQSERKRFHFEYGGGSVGRENALGLSGSFGSINNDKPLVVVEADLIAQPGCLGHLESALDDLLALTGELQGKRRAIFALDVCP